MSRCDDEKNLKDELLRDAIVEATEFLFDTCPGAASRIMRGEHGEHGAIFILRDPDDVLLFTKLYVELFQTTTEEQVDVLAAGVAYNVPPDYESN